MVAERYNGLTKRSLKNRRFVEANLAYTMTTMEALNRIRTAYPDLFLATARHSRLLGEGGDVRSLIPRWFARPNEVRLGFLPSDKGNLHELAAAELEAIHQRVRTVDRAYHAFVLRYEKVSCALSSPPPVRFFSSPPLRPPAGPLTDDMWSVAAARSPQARGYEAANAGRIPGVAETASTASFAANGGRTGHDHVGGQGYYLGLVHHQRHPGAGAPAGGGKRHEDQQQRRVLGVRRQQRQRVRGVRQAALLAQVPAVPSLPAPLSCACSLVRQRRAVRWFALSPDSAFILLSQPQLVLCCC